jgi:LmbE family N-acetylglucosaminyl deacetylase
MSGSNLGAERSDRLADAGARVVLLCASRGEKGAVSNPAIPC